MYQKHPLWTVYGTLGLNALIDKEDEHQNSLYRFCCLVCLVFIGATYAVTRRSVVGPYETYEGSPMSKGLLQHDLWNVKAPSNRWDWDTLRTKIAQHGVRNSLLVAPMPTASTSQVDCYTCGTPADHAICCLSEMIENINIETGVWRLSLHANNLRRGGLNTYNRDILPTKMLIGNASLFPSNTRARLDLPKKICCTRWSRQFKIVWAETCMLQWSMVPAALPSANAIYAMEDGYVGLLFVVCESHSASIQVLVIPDINISEYCSSIVIALHTHSWSPGKTQG